MTQIVQIPTSIHGRVLIEDAAVPPSAGVLIAFHGYGERADDVLAEINRIPGADAWTRVAPQALHRFYTRKHERVVASWMTQEDRELAIDDNVAYINAVLAAIPSSPSGPRVFVGFSQGASMAYRAALLCQPGASGVVAVAGDIPPEVKAQTFHRWPSVLIGAGNRDEWFAGRLEADLAFLRDRQVPHAVVRFEGAHEWTDELRVAIGAWLLTRTQSQKTRT